MNDVSSPTVRMYTTLLCPFCVRAKRLLESKNVSFEEIRVDSDQAQFEKMLALSNGQRSVPQIFIGDLHVGGSDELYALESAGKLDALLGIDSP